MDVIILNIHPTQFICSMFVSLIEQVKRIQYGRKIIKEFLWLTLPVAVKAEPKFP